MDQEIPGTHRIWSLISSRPMEPVKVGEKRALAHPAEGFNGPPGRRQQAAKPLDHVGEGLMPRIVFRAS